MFSILDVQKWALFFSWNLVNFSETACSFSVSYHQNYPYLNAENRRSLYVLKGTNEGLFIRDTSQVDFLTFGNQQLTNINSWPIVVWSGSYFNIFVLTFKYKTFQPTYKFVYPCLTKSK